MMTSNIACSLNSAFASTTLDFSPVYEAIRATDLRDADAEMWEATLLLHQKGYRNMFLVGATRMGHIITLNTKTSEVQFRNKVTFDVETSANLSAMPNCFQKAIRKCVNEFVAPKAMTFTPKSLSQALNDAVSLLNTRAYYANYAYR